MPPFSVTTKHASQSEPGTRARNGTDGLCLLCGALGSRLVVRGPDYEYQSLPGEFEIVRCVACRHLYVHPLPQGADSARIYPSTYYTVNPRSPLHLGGVIYRTKVRRDVGRILRHCADERPKSVLDLGCGDAARLFALREILGPGPQLCGVDLRIGPEVRESASRYGIELVPADVESGLDRLADSAYDLILMCQLLEHLRDPKAALGAAHRKLMPGGRLLVETPNLAGLDYRLFRRRYWGGYHIPRHFHLFTSDSLRGLLRQTKYEIAGQGSLPSPGIWIISLRNALGLDSICRGGSVFEFLNFSNIAVVTALTLADILYAHMGGKTSNQYALAQKD